MQALKVPLYSYHDIINYINNLITFFDLSPVPANSAVGPIIYVTSCCGRNLSSRTLNKSIDCTSTTQLGNLFHTALRWFLWHMKWYSQEKFQNFKQSRHVDWHFMQWHFKYCSNFCPTAEWALSEGRAIGMSCHSSVCPSVRPSVTDVLWLNGARYGLDCYWSLIESRILAFKWRVSHWPWMTLKGNNALWQANHAVLWVNGKS